MGKEKILKIIRAKEDRKKALAEKSDKATTVEELRSINEDIKRIKTEIEELLITTRCHGCFSIFRVKI